MPNIAKCLDVDTSALLSTIQPNEAPQVIIVDDEHVAIAGAIPVLEEVLPQAAITSFTKPYDALVYVRVHSVALVGLVLTLVVPFVKQRERLYFCATFMLLLLYTIADLVAQIALNFLGADYALLAQVNIFCELLYSALILPLMTAFLLHCAREDWRHSSLLRVAVVLWAAYVVVLVVAQFSGNAVYSVSIENSRVIAGSLFPVLIVLPLVLMLLNLVALARRRAALTGRQRAAFAIYIGLPLISTLLQGVFFDLRVIVIGTAVAALAMLAVESARLEDGLVVEIDCPHVAFRLPPLTLQPLVENAVKHGADPELPPLHVRVATYEESGCSVVTVEDTGPGFDEELLSEIMGEDGAEKALDFDEIADWTTDPTSALVNIRQRLASNGSSLDILPRREGGTVVIVRVPAR